MRRWTSPGWWASWLITEKKGARMSTIHLHQTTESNTWGGNSGHTYNFTRRPNGATDIDLVVVRDGKNLKGRFLSLVLATVGKGVLEKAFAASVKAIEARNGVAKGGGASRAT